MLFALDWIKRTWDSMVSWILALTEGLNLASLSAALTGHVLVLAGCCLGGLVLCAAGFRYHKLVIGLTCGVLAGIFGWYAGRAVNAGLLTVPAVYAAMLSVTGFFACYLLYFLAVFAGGWFLFLAGLASWAGALRVGHLWIAALLAAGYTALYIKYKPALSAVTGALLLGLLAVSRSPALGALTACACAAGGIPLQRRLKARDDARRSRDAQAQREKYPYGPGLAYGWPEPGQTAPPSTEQKG